MKKCFSWLLLLILLCPSMQYAAQPSIGVTDRICQFLVIAASMFAAGVVSTIGHELGHAVAANILWDNPIAITIGSYLYYGKGLNFDFSLKSLGIVAPGMAFWKRDQVKRPKLEQLAVYSAGPICGAISSLLMYCLLKKVASDWEFGGRIVAQRELKLLTAIICYTHLSNLIPFYLSENRVSDGANIAIAYNLIDRKSIKPITWYLKALDCMVVGLMCWKLK